MNSPKTSLQLSAHLQKMISIEVKSDDNEGDFFPHFFLLITCSDGTKYEYALSAQSRSNEFIFPFKFSEVKY